MVGYDDNNLSSLFKPKTVMAKWWGPLVMTHDFIGVVQRGHKI